MWTHFFLGLAAVVAYSLAAKVMFACNYRQVERNVRISNSSNLRLVAGWTGWIGVFALLLDISDGYYTDYPLSLLTCVFFLFGLVANGVHGTQLDNVIQNKEEELHKAHRRRMPAAWDQDGRPIRTTVLGHDK